MSRSNETPELAELQASWPTLKAAYDEAQATIERLTAELADRKRKHLRSCQIAIGKSQLAKERYVEIERLKSESFEELYNAVIDERDALAERLKGGQGEPISVVPSFKDGVEAAAKFVEKRMDDYVNEHGSEDPETGSIELPGTGDEYVGELMEIVESIRTIACLDKVKELNQ